MDLYDREVALKRIKSVVFDQKGSRATFQIRIKRTVNHHTPCCNCLTAKTASWTVGLNVNFFSQNDFISHKMGENCSVMPSLHVSIVLSQPSAKSKALKFVRITHILLRKLTQSFLCVFA